MKIRLSIFLLIFSVIVTYSQENLTEKLYLRALEENLKQYDLWASQGVGIVKPRELFIAYNDFIKNYPVQINGTPLTVLTKDNWKKTFRKKGNELAYIELESIKIIDEELKITLTKIESKLKRRKFISAYGDWSDVYFKYNCEENKWEYDRLEIRGI